MELTLTLGARCSIWKHPRKIAELPSDLAAQCAVDRAEDLIEQMAVDELEDSGCFAKETVRIFCLEPETKPTALSVKGKGKRAIASGDSFGSLPQHDLTRRIGRECIH